MLRSGRSPGICVAGIHKPAFQIKGLCCPVSFDCLFRAAVPAVWKKGMPDIPARRAGLKERRPAGRTGVGFFLFASFHRNHDPVDGSARPVEEPAGTGPDRVFADRTEESFVGFPVLPDDPEGLGKCNGTDEMHQYAANGQKKRNDQEILEIPGRKVLMNHQADLEEGGTSECKEDGKIDMRPFSYDQDCGNSKEGNQYGELEERQFQPVFLQEAIVLLSGRLALGFDAHLRLFLLLFECMLLTDQVGHGLIHRLIFPLIFQEKVQAARDVVLLFPGKGDVLLDAEFLEFQELVDGLLKIPGAVSDKALGFLLIHYLQGDIVNLLCKGIPLLD